MDDLRDDIEAIRNIAAVPSILSVLASNTGMRFVAVARVTASRWVACEVLDQIQFGLESGGELPIETTICHEVRSLRARILIDDVSQDPLFHTHRTPAIYGFRSYVSVPIIMPDGEIFGTLCAIDPEPRQLKGTSAEDMFKLFADLIAFHIDSNRKLAEIQADLFTSQIDFADSQEKLLDAMATGELREQFIAVLGHDLRNPLASISAGIRLLEKTVTEQAGNRVLRLMTASAQRMSGLIDNILDFARGRLGAGIAIDVAAGQPIEPVLLNIVNEIRSAHPESTIETHFDIERPIDADPARIGQMFSNLLGNAVTHGATDKPIVVTAAVADSVFRLSITNGGDPIPPAARERLFQPFYRGHVRPSQEGLGLGLFIASEIARAHGGTLDVVSNAMETRFTFSMPV